jgi:glutaredoxin 3
MGWFDGLTGGGADPQQYEAPRGIPDPDAPRELVLYQYQMCGFCARVRRAMDRLGLTEQVRMEDTLRDPDARQRLVQAMGRGTVPVLFIDGVPLPESADIIDWLEAYAVRGAQG